MRKPISIDQCFLYQCRSKRKLAEKLGVTYEELGSRSEWIRYRISTRPKSHGGGERIIYAPCQKLKQVQNRIFGYMQRIEKPAWVFSGTKGKSYVDNARAHQGNRYFLTADIESFYESCTREMVYRFFKHVLRTAPDIAAILTDITTCENPEGRVVIPSGSPCSQLLAFFAYRDMFIEINGCAAQYGCTMSLYVDDITLSSFMPISDPKKLEKDLSKIARAYGHRLKAGKTKYIGSNDFKIVTGVAIDGMGDIHVPNRLGESVVRGLRESNRGDVSVIAPTLGRIVAARQIDRNAFLGAERSLKRLLDEQS